MNVGLCRASDLSYSYSYSYSPEGSKSKLKIKSKAACALDGLAEDAEDVVLAHDQVGGVLELDLGAAVLGDEHFVALLDDEVDGLAIFIALAGAEGDHFAFLGLLFRGVGNDDPAFFGLSGVQGLDEHPVTEGTNV